MVSRDQRDPLVCSAPKKETRNIILARVNTKDSVEHYLSYRGKHIGGGTLGKSCNWRNKLW